MSTLLTEEERVTSWRAERFGALGFSPAQVAVLLSWSASVHQVERLLRDGCPKMLAMRIVRP